MVIDLSIYFALPLILPVYNLSQETASLTIQMLLIHTLAAVCIWPLTFDLPASMRAAMAVDWLFRAVVFSLLWLGGKWKLKRII